MNRRTFLGRALALVAAPRLLPTGRFAIDDRVLLSPEPARFIGGWRTPTTFTTGDLVDTSVFNSHVRDGLRYRDVPGLRLPA